VQPHLDPPSIAVHAQDHPVGRLVLHCHGIAGRPGRVRTRHRHVQHRVGTVVRGGHDAIFPDAVADSVGSSLVTNAEWCDSNVMRASTAGLSISAGPPSARTAVHPALMAPQGIGHPADTLGDRLYRTRTAGARRRRPARIRTVLQPAPSPPSPEPSSPAAFRTGSDRRPRANHRPEHTPKRPARRNSASASPEPIASSRLCHSEPSRCRGRKVSARWAGPLRSHVVKPSS
jgi:hypothetical protein